MTEKLNVFDPRTYDDVYGGFIVDVPEVVALLKQAGGPVLEVCCGNGRLLIPALHAGVEADGLDLEAGMLDDLRVKLAARKLNARLFRADMRDFALADRYATILIAFNSFFHNLTQSDQIATLTTCRRHLLPGGRLAIIAFHPSAPLLIQYGSGTPVMVEEPHGDGRLRVYDSSTQDRVEQVSHVTRRMEYVDREGRVVRSGTASFDIRYVYKPEMELLFRVAGFDRWQTRPLFINYRDPESVVTGRGAMEGDHLLYTAWNS